MKSRIIGCYLLKVVRGLEVIHCFVIRVHFFNLEFETFKILWEEVEGIPSNYWLRVDFDRLKLSMNKHYDLPLA
jgi:hypothetical protein